MTGSEEDSAPTWLYVRMRHLERNVAFTAKGSYIFANRQGQLMNIHTLSKLLCINEVRIYMLKYQCKISFDAEGERELPKSDP